LGDIELRVLGGIGLDVLKNMEQLSQLCGVSGWEGPVREAILACLEDQCSCTVDALGNVIAHKKGQSTPKNKIMLTAHMDEVGFIITHVEDSGLLRFASVGGIDSRVVVGKPVEVGEQRLCGVIGTKAVHLQEEKERGTPQKLDQLYMDIGAENKEDALAHVAPGDRAVFSAPFGRLGENKVYGRALDDRAGCAMLLELAGRELPYDCTLVFTVQEEVGCIGARAAAHSVNPDIAIVVETTTASDIAGVEPDKTVCKQGEGPVLSFMDRAAVYDRALYRLAIETAKERGIPCQCKAGVYGGNEAGTIQTMGDGVRVVGVSLPCRYLHSPTNVLQVEDVENTIQLLEALVEATALV